MTRALPALEPLSANMIAQCLLSYFPEAGGSVLDADGRPPSLDGVKGEARRKAAVP